MQIGLTINLGNYESLRLDTSEFETLEACRVELSLMIADFKDYIPNKKILEMGHIIETIKNAEKVPAEVKVTPQIVDDAGLDQKDIDAYLDMKKKYKQYGKWASDKQKNYFEALKTKLEEAGYKT